MKTKDFFRAVALGDKDAVANMVKDDSSLALAFDDDGATALHHAAFHGHREMVELLQDAGGDINARDRTHGATPAGWAIHYLRERGALLAIEIEDLRFAMERGDVTWAERMLARHPWLAHASDREGKPLADYAAGDPAITRLFESYLDRP